MIKARRRGLIIMKQQGITPVHQVLDNKITQTYKDEIRDLGMLYQLVPPDDHRRNIAERAIQTWRNHFSEFSAERPPRFPYTYGVKPPHRPNANSCSSQCQMSTQKYPHTPTSMVNMTTTPIHSYLLEWSIYFTTSQTVERPLPHIVERDTSLAPLSNTTEHGRFGI